MVETISSGAADGGHAAPPPAEALVEAHREGGALDTAALAAALHERAGGDGQATAVLQAQVEAQLTPSERGALQRELDTLRAGGDDSEGFGAVIDGAVRGDYSDNNSWSSLGGQVGIGFVPVLGQIADARDTVAAIGDVISGEDGAWGNLGLAAVAWVPGVGDAAKGVLRGGDKAASELAEQAARGTDAAPEAGGAARATDEIGEAGRLPAFSDGARHVDPETGRTVVDAQRGTTGSWSDVLNGDLEPEAIYRTDNDYRYFTDGQGRVDHVEGQLELDREWPRNSYQQRVAGGEDRLAGDQGGHFFARQFGGPGEAINLSPQDGDLNQGVWNQMEERWADALERGQEVNVAIDPVYSGDSLRPSRYDVTYQVQGEMPVTRSFQNQPGG